MDEEGENEFVTEQVQDIARQAINQCLMNASYNREKVGAWCTQIGDSCLKELAKLDKPFKYIATCVIMQNCGSPLHTAATTFWDTKTDGLCCLQVGNDTMDCIVTIYAMQI
eukprot:GHVQ01007963.1.p1 GENE.GHVQ01007963.1~~GHVQ01007963.1.p1  ORF type:complete len:111 (-),score=15.21 GHVQ01007963.1:101-433(-)